MEECESASGLVTHSSFCSKRCVRALFDSQIKSKPHAKASNLIGWPNSKFWRNIILPATTTAIVLAAIIAAEGKCGCFDVCTKIFWSVDVILHLMIAFQFCLCSHFNFPEFFRGFSPTGSATGATIQNKRDLMQICNGVQVCTHLGSTCQSILLIV